MAITCKVCSTEMTIGFAIDAGPGDHVRTIRERWNVQAEDLKLVNCWKCPSCGHSVDITWRNIIYSEIDTSSAVGEVMSEFFQLSPEEISEFIESIDTKKVAVVHALAVLRGNFARRRMIPSWYGFRDKMYDEFKMRGKDSDKIMVGLFKKE